MRATLLPAFMPQAWEMPLSHVWKLSTPLWSSLTYSIVQRYAFTCVTESSRASRVTDTSWMRVCVRSCVAISAAVIVDDRSGVDKPSKTR